jgi:hypothetical protein
MNQPKPKRESAKATLAAVRKEMALPRVAESARTVGNPHSNIISSFKGIFARVARKLNVDPSLVSRVAKGTRHSPEIDIELRIELKALKKLLANYD